VHLGKRRATQAQALKHVRFTMVWLFQKKLPMELGHFVMRNRAGKIQKNIITPSKIVNRGGEMIPRCWSGRCGHGGGCTKTLALAKLGLKPTDSSVKLVLT
jgi:hypothetical protein